MSTLTDMLQQADQLFDENKYQEALDLLSNYSVKTKTNIKYLLV